MKNKEQENISLLISTVFMIVVALAMLFIALFYRRTLILYAISCLLFIETVMIARIIGGMVDE